MYETVLAHVQPGRELCPAVSEETRDSILSEEITRLMLDERIHRLLCFSVESEEIVEWKP